ncbi:MAG: hypothetical protein ABFS38_02750 [Bacteroidota bacterium]
MRRREVLTGLIIILVAFGFITSLLLDFNFVSPYATLQEDLSYLSDHIQNQRISSWSWLATGLITFIAVPFYVVIFSNKLKVLHFANGLFMLGASAGFVVMGLTGLELHQTMVQSFGEGFEQVNDQIKFSLLEQFREEQFYRHIGSSFVGLFAIGLSFSKFKLGRFPLFSMILLLLSGPTLIFFNWYDPDHLVRTMAMAGIMIGVVVFCVRLINKGLSS